MHAVENTVKVESSVGCPILWGELIYGACNAAAGIVDQNIYLAPSCNDCVARGFDLRRNRNIASHGIGFASDVLNHLCSDIELFYASAKQGDL